jgi:hypothetical protein
MLRRKKVVMPSRAAQLLGEIKRLAQKGLDAKTMTTKDEKLRGIIKKIKDNDMREIKFRAYIYDLTNEDSHPLEIDVRAGKLWDVASINFKDQMVEIVDDDGNVWEHELSSDEIALMQYVGSKDRNGREIYEGDIVRHHHNKNKTNYVVEWSDASFGFIATPIKENPGRPHLNQATMLSYEIVGNIYKNPELLK